MVRKISHTLGVAALMLASWPATADDIEIYYGGAGAAGMPYVMFSLDFRPNLGSQVCQNGECDFLVAEGWLPAASKYTFFDMLRAVLRKVMDPLENINVGLMINHDNIAKCDGPNRTGCSNGGYMALGFEPFVLNDTNGAKAQFHAILDAIPTPQGNLSHSYQGKELFFELFRYITGQDVHNAHNGWTDFGSDAVANLDADFPLIAWDKSIEIKGGRQYASPLRNAASCAKLFTLNTLFFVANQEDDSDVDVALPLTSGGTGGPKADFTDMIRFMANTDLADGSFGNAPNLDGDQTVTSYFLVDPTKINKTTMGYAQAGKTVTPLPLSDDPAALIATLQDIFQQILSVSTTFVAASIPVNVFNRAEIIDNIYLALFQPDESARPYWVGNVKKLRLAGLSTATPAVVDATGNPAVAADGRIRFDALTYWTSPGDLPPPDTSKGEIAGKDGRSVARGGAGQIIPGYISGSPGFANSLVSGRRLFFDNTTSSFGALDADPATAGNLQADLNAATAGEARVLIAHARGTDIQDLDGDGNTSEARAWTFADPLHSRPLPINYGLKGGYSANNPAIYIAVASNDGFLHFIRNTNPDGSQSGAEVWGFMPREAMGIQKDLYSNAPIGRHPYSFDGSPVTYIEDLNANGTIELGDRVWLFVAMRRGGRALYGINVSDPQNPDLMWRIQKGGKFSELSLTFSNPRVGLVDTGGGPRPVITFGGGYDANKDLRSGVGTDDSEGNAIYVVDAETGQLIWKAVGGAGSSTSEVFYHPMLVDSIPSTVSAVDMDGNGLLDRIIVGDTGGNVWRADIGSKNTSDWQLTILGRLGRHAPGAAGVASDRRFFHRPDIGQNKDKDGPFDAVIIGSGDRADPLDKGGVADNWFYVIKDRNIGSGAGINSLLVHSDLGDVTDDCLTDGNCTTDLTPGWRIELEDRGEKSLSTPLTIGGTVFFTTYLPTPPVVNSCEPSEGRGRLYAVSLQDASPVVNYDQSDDDPNYPDEPTTKDDRSTMLNSDGIPPEVVSVPPNRILRPDLTLEETNVSMRWRTFWFESEDADL